MQLVHWESVQAYKIISKLKLNQEVDDPDLDEEENNSQISNDRYAYFSRIPEISSGEISPLTKCFRKCCTHA